MPRAEENSLGDDIFDLVYQAYASAFTYDPRSRRMRLIPGEDGDRGIRKMSDVREQVIAWGYMDETTYAALIVNAGVKLAGELSECQTLSPEDFHD